MNIFSLKPAVLISALSLSVILAFSGNPAMAETPEEKGLRIALEGEARDKGFGNYTADQTMILRNKRGQESERNLRISVLEDEADGDKSLIVFNRPRDVKGTADCFHECFIDDGQVDTFAVVQRLHELGFDGFMIPDHVPATVGDSSWHHRGRAHCVGFMQALIQVAEKLNPEAA